MGKYTTINIRPETKARLEKLMRYGDTPDSFLNHLMDSQKPVEKFPSVEETSHLVNNESQ